MLICSFHLFYFLFFIFEGICSFHLIVFWLLDQTRLEKTQSSRRKYSDHITIPHQPKSDHTILKGKKHSQKHSDQIKSQQIRKGKKLTENIQIALDHIISYGVPNYKRQKNTHEKIFRLDHTISEHIRLKNAKSTHIQYLDQIKKLEKSDYTKGRE